MPQAPRSRRAARVRRPGGAVASRIRDASRRPGPLHRPGWRGNRDAFIDIWGPRIFRDALLDALDGGDRFSSDPFHVAIVTAGNDRSGHRGSDRGTTSAGPSKPSAGASAPWPAPTTAGTHAIRRSRRSSCSTTSCDVRRLPRKLVTMAWIGDEPDDWLDRPWFDDFDLVFASTDRDGRDGPRAEREGRALVPIAGTRLSRRAPQAAVPSAGAIRDALIHWATATTIRIADRGAELGRRRALGRLPLRARPAALAGAGRPSDPAPLPARLGARSPTRARTSPSTCSGCKEAPTRAARSTSCGRSATLTWPTPEIYERYDHVFVASDRFAARMAERVAVPVTPLHQATDPERFRPDPSGPRHELLFVANSRKVRRRIVDDLAGTTARPRDLRRRLDAGPRRPALRQGRGRSRTPSLRATTAPPRSCSTTTGTTCAPRASSRTALYDALACGAFVISDAVAGIEAEFDGAVATYARRGRARRGSIDRYLADPDERRRRAARGRAAVLARHTFDERTRVVCEVADRLAATRPTSIDANAVASGPVGASAARRAGRLRPSAGGAGAGWAG